MLRVSPNGYYDERRRVPSLAAEPLPAAWQVAALRVFTTHAGRYGQRRLRAQLRREGHAVGRQRLHSCDLDDLIIPDGRSRLHYLESTAVHRSVLSQALLCYTTDCKYPRTTQRRKNLKQLAD
ncbi:MAG: hypothetical protein EOO61_18780 [Hymenobacter sp.]|nr:MAG: hypothetical protein EOO61_18780 [Hymenobacter sp.]